MNVNTPPKLNQLLATLRQPQWIAAIVSLGFHGVLFAAGPSFSSLNTAALSDSELSERRVPLIELTPAEQDRLPDFSAPAYSLFPESNDDLFSLFPPSGDSLPLNPGTGPRSSFSIPTPKLPSSSFPGGISPYTFPRRPSIVLPSRRSSLPPIPSDSSVAQRPTPSSEAAGSSAASTPIAEGAADGARPGAVNPNSSPEDSSQAAVEGVPSETNPATGEMEPSSEQASDLLARVEYSDTQTSESEVEFAKAAWLQTVKEKLGDAVVEAPEPITLEVPYSGRLCLSPEPTEGLLGLVGVPDETPEGLTLWTSVLKSTGYPFLNQAAEQALQGITQQADADGNTLEPNTLYQVVVKVEYDSETCLSREALLQSRTAASDDTDSQPE